jgi:hypothetical protein
VGDIIHPVRHRLAHFRIWKVVRVDCARLPLGAILSAAVFLVAQRLFLLRIDRERRASAAPLRCDAAIEVRELRIAIRRVFAFPGLPIRL